MELAESDRAELATIEALCKLATRYRVDRLEARGVVIEKRQHAPTAVAVRRPVRAPEAETPPPRLPLEGDQYGDSDEERVLFHSSRATRLTRRRDLTKFSANRPPDALKEEKTDGEA